MTTLPFWGRLMSHLGETLPPFKFDRELFLELISTKSNGKQVEGDLPEVHLTMGPLDGELGRFEPKENRIFVDVLEIFLMTLHGPPVPPEELKRRFDERLTKTLAHEGAHWRIEQRWGKLLLLEKVGLHFFFLMTLWLVFDHAMKALAGLIYKLTISQFVLLGEPWSWILTIVISIPMVWVGYKLIMWFIRIWQWAAWALTYKACTHERYARSAEKTTDPRWEKVVVIEE